MFLSVVNVILPKRIGIFQSYLIMEKIDSYKNEEGVSPVIGVILMVAITVVLAAAIGVFLTGMGDNLEENSTSGVSVQQVSDGIEVSWIDSQNSSKIVILRNGDEIGTLSTVGGTKTVAVNEGDTVTVIGVTEDGNETVLSTSTSSKSLGDTSITAMASFNPPAEGVTVKALDSSGNVLGQDTTGPNGEFNVPSGADSYTLNGYTINKDLSSGVDVEIDTTDVAKGGDTVPDVLMNGSGTSTDPYQVEHASDLQAMDRELGASYKLTGNIDASNTTDWNSGKGFNPVGGFSGTLNGSGYTISGLTIDRPSEGDLGLMGDSSGTIKNIGLSNVYVNGDGFYVAGLASRNSGTISNSYVSGTVTGVSSFTGGVVGRNKSGGTISKVYSQTSVSGDAYVGGVVGDNDGGTVARTYSAGSVNGNNTVGGIIGTNSGDASKSYSDSNESGTGTAIASNTGTSSDIYRLTTSDMQGSSASTNMGTLDFTTGDGDPAIWATVGGEYPDLQSEN